VGTYTSAARSEVGTYVANFSHYVSNRSAEPKYVICMIEKNCGRTGRRTEGQHWHNIVGMSVKHYDVIGKTGVQESPGAQLVALARIEVVNLSARHSDGFA
jgi:hypothetical protein